jgi:hypothetical protein
MLANQKGLFMARKQASAAALLALTALLAACSSLTEWG